jgi:hypothetical protein
MLTVVVLTPHGSRWTWGVVAAGVSMNSNESSDVVDWVFDMVRLLPTNPIDNLYNWVILGWEQNVLCSPMTILQASSPIREMQNKSSCAAWGTINSRVARRKSIGHLWETHPAVLLSSSCFRRAAFVELLELTWTAFIVLLWVAFVKLLFVVLLSSCCFRWLVGIRRALPSARRLW